MISLLFAAYFEADYRLPIVHVDVTFSGGASLDLPGLEGTHHVLAELLKRGTKKKSKSEVELELDRLGAKLEVTVNKEALSIMGGVLAKNLDPFLKLLEEIITEPKFNSTELKKVVLEAKTHISEAPSHDQPFVAAQFDEWIYFPHSYGRSIQGYVDALSRLTRTHILQAYEQSFNRSNFLIVGTGATANLNAFEQSLSSKLKPGNKPPFPKPEWKTKTQLLLIDKPNRTQSQIIIGHPGIHPNEADFKAFYLAMHAFGGHTFSAKLLTEVRVKRGWGYGAYSNNQFGIYPHSLKMTLFPNIEVTAPAIELVIDLFKQLKNNGLTEQEFEFAKNSLIQASGFTYDTPGKRVNNKKLEVLLGLEEDFFKKLGPSLSAITLAETNALLKKRLDPELLSIVVLATKEKVLDSLKPLAPTITVIPYDKKRPWRE